MGHLKHLPVAINIEEPCQMCQQGQQVLSNLEDLWLYLGGMKFWPSQTSNGLMLAGNSDAQIKRKTVQQIKKNIYIHIK